MSDPLPAHPSPPVDYASPATPTKPRAAPLGAIAGRGVLFMTGVTLLTRVMGIVQQIALAWFLLPDDFGKFALAMTASIVGGIIAKPGIEDFLIQRGKRMRAWENEAFWLSATLGMAGSLIMMLSGWIGSRIYGDPVIFHLLLVASIGILAQSLSTVAGCKLSTDLRFARTAWISTIAAALAPVLAISLGWYGAGPFALMIPLAVLPCVVLLLMWHFAAPRVRPGMNVRRWRFIVAPTLLRGGSRFAWAIVASADYMALGTFATKSVVGTYFYAFNMATQVSRLLGQNLSTVLMPSLSSIADDRKRQTDATLRSIRLIAIATTPVSVSLAAIASPLVRTIAPREFEAAVPLIQILSIATVTNAAFSAAHALILARGEFARELRWAWISVSFFVALVFPLTSVGGAIGAASAVWIYSWIDQSVRLKQFIGPEVDYLELGRTFVRPLVCSTVAYGSIALALSFVPVDGRLWYGASCVAVCLVGSAIYLGLMWIVDKPLLSDLLTRGRRMIR